MSDFREALELQVLLEEVADRIKESQQGRSYLSLDGRAFVLAVGGDGAEVMQDFMRAVGQYLVKVRQPHADKEAAKRDVLRAFDEWLSKQNI